MIAVPRRTAQRFLEAELRQKERERLKERERRAVLLADPVKLDKLVADIAVNLAPKVAKPRYAKYGTRVEAVDARAKDTPMEGFADALKANIVKVLEAPNLQEAPTRTAVAAVTDLMMGLPGPKGRSRLEESHLYKWRADTAIGAFGEDTSVRALPGYEEYRAKEIAKPSREEWTHPAVSAAIGGGASAAWVGAKHGLAKAGSKWAMKRLAAARAGAILGPYGAIAAGALSAIPAFAAFDVVEEVLEKTEWGKARKGTWKRFGVEALAGLGTYYGATRTGLKALEKAVGEGILSERAISLLKRFPTAARAIDAADAKKAADAAIAKANTEIARITPLKRTKAGIYEALLDPSEVALEEALIAAQEGRAVTPSLIRDLHTITGWRAEEGARLADVLTQQVVKKTGVARMVRGLEVTRVKAAARREAKKEVSGMVKSLEALGWKVPGKVDHKKAFTSLSDEMADVAIRRSETVGIKQASLEAREMDQVLKKGVAKSLTDEKAGGSLERLTKKAEKKVVKKVKEPPTYVAKEVEAELPGIITPKYRGVKAPEETAAFELADKLGLRFEAYTAPEKSTVGTGYMFSMTEKAHPMWRGKETSFSVEKLRDLPAKIKAVSATWNIPSILRKVGTETPVSKVKRLKLTRILEEGEIPSTTKPQGLYFTVGEVSPHRDIGRKEIEAIAKGRTVLNVPSIKVSHTRFGEFKSGEASSGISALKKLTSEKEFSKLMKSSKGELVVELSKKYPEVQWNRYYDSYEILEGYAGILARKRGYSAILQADKIHPEFSEYIALTDEAFKIVPTKTEGLKLIKERVELSRVQKREAKLRLAIAEQETEMTVEAELARKHFTRGLTEEQKEELFVRHKYDILDMFKSVALMVGTGSIFSVLSPRDADAGVLHKAGLQIPKVVISAIKKAKDPKKIVMEMTKARYFVPPVNPNTPKVLPDFARTIDSAKAFVETGKRLTQIITRTKPMIPGGARAGAPTLVNDTMYKTGYGPAPQLAHMQTNAWGHIENATVVMNNILGPKYKSEARLLIDTMKPLAERFGGDVGAYTTLEFKVDRQRAALDKLWEGLVKKRRKPFVRKEGTRIKAIEVLEEKIAKNEAVMTRLEPTFRAYLNEWEATVRPLAGEHSTVRISLAAEDTVDYKYYPWLRGILTPEEKATVEHIKNFHEAYAVRMLEAGGDVITTRPYVHHAFHPSWTEVAARKRLGELGVDIGDAIPYSKFFRRTKHSRQMVPDIAYNMQKYIPDAERRCGWMEFWRRKDKDSWYAHMHSNVVRDSEELSRFWRQIRRGAVPAADTPLNRMMNRYSAFEVLRLIAWAPAPALKHYLKNIGAWSIFGFKSAGTHLLPSQTVAFRNQINSPAGQKFLSRLGLKGGIRKKFMDDAIKAATNQGRMLNVIADLEADVLINRTGIMGQFDKWMLRLNRSGSIPIRMIEAGDRAHTVLMAVDIAAKKGMTAQQAMYGVYSTILRCNFLSGNLNPTWMRNPTVRALTLFQNTVFKIADRRLVTAVRSGQGVKLAFGVVKKEGVGQVLKELRELGRYMQGAELEFKQHLIFDALTSEKNVFGSPILSEFMRELLLAGIIIGGGNAVGLDFHAHVHHLPFFRVDRADPTLAMNPALSSYFQFRQERAEAAEYDEDKEFFINHFLRRYISSTGPMPRTMTKILRISDEDIPEVYRGSKWQYMFSVPSKDEEY